jgi:hypothetical protein
MLSSDAWLLPYITPLLPYITPPLPYIGLMKRYTAAGKRSGGAPYLYIRKPALHIKSQ